MNIKWIIIVVLAVVILYNYIGQEALYGLLAIVFGAKGKNKERIEKAREERDEHEQLREQADNSAREHIEEAQEIADDITPTPDDEPVPDGHTRKRFSAE